ncbi:Alpha/Beta hydrolase protein [Gorgonomyces haynaldii]|nr:Alpha/Beta hydrolase protein [Gorgonomyces haynaldii]
MSLQLLSTNLLLAISGYVLYKYYVPAETSELGPMTPTKDYPDPTLKARLSHGLTAYQLHGNPKKPKLVLVHGVSTPPHALGHIADHLSKDFYVLTYDLYGRGYSSSPGMGGAIAALYADLFPSHIEKLVGRKRLVLLARKGITGQTDSPGSPELSFARNEYHLLHHPGVIRAYWSSLVHFPLQGLQPGTSDQVVPFTCASELLRLMPKSTLLTKQSASHAIVTEYPVFLSTEIKRFHQ